MIAMNAFTTMTATTNETRLPSPIQPNWPAEIWSQCLNSCSAVAPVSVGTARKKLNSAAVLRSTPKRHRAKDRRARTADARDHRQALDQADRRSNAGA